MSAGLARAGAEREGDVTPGVEEGRRRRQMEDDAAHRADDADAQLEEPLAQRRHLRARAGRAGGPQPEFLHEDVRGGGEEHAQLIGPEATAAGAAPSLRLSRVGVAGSEKGPYVNWRRRAPR